MKFFKHNNKIIIRVRPARYLVIEINKSRFGLPFYFARHWKGIKWPSRNNKSDRSYVFAVFLVHFTYNSYGMIIRPDDWPKDWGI